MNSISDNQMVQTKSTQASLDPHMALDMLQAGNNRFLENRMLDRDLAVQVSETATGQFPFAAVLGCIDSRVPAEVVFDQGIGDIFNVRIAGNFVNTDILGSLEFACKVAGSKIIVVLGHSSCGAIKGACDQVELGNLTAMLDKIRPAVESVDHITEQRNSGNSEFVKYVTEANITRALSEIKTRSAVLSEMINNKEILLVGALYDVSTGKVTFRNFVS